MSKYIDDAHLIMMLAVCCLFQIDPSILGADVKAILIIIFALLFLAARIVMDKGFAVVRRENIDIAAYASGAFALSNMAYKLFVRPDDSEKYMALLSLCILYFVIRNYCWNIGSDVIFLVSILNAAVSIVLLYRYLVGAELEVLVSALLKNGACLSWLVLSITINVIGFCIYDGKELWYGANAVIGFFLLFIQNNVAAAAIVFFMFWQTAAWYAPRKIMVKRVMQMFFAYAFLLCNMCLITNYTKLLKVELAYDLESGVYMELALAAFGAWFFHVWDKAADGENIDDADENAVLAQFGGFFKKARNIAIIMIAVIVAAAIRGKVNILAEVFEKLAALCRQSMESQTGIFEMANALYGMPGLIMAGGLVVGVACILTEYRKSMKSRQRKLFGIVSWVFVAQALFLTQSFASMPMYIIFIAIMLNGRGACVVEMKEEVTNEADNSDSVLQRGADLGDSAE